MTRFKIRKGDSGSNTAFFIAQRALCASGKEMNCTGLLKYRCIAMLLKSGKNVISQDQVDAFQRGLYDGLIQEVHDDEYDFGTSTYEAYALGIQESETYRIFVDL